MSDDYLSVVHLLLFMVIETKIQHLIYVYYLAFTTIIMF